jgi:transglutaminase-like putative cysteine protease
MTGLVSAALARIGWRSIATLGLLCVGLASVVLETADAFRGLDVWLLIWVLVLSLIYGWAVACTRLQQARALAILLLTGLGVTAFSVSTLWQRFAALLAALFEYGPYAQRTADPATLVRAGQELGTATQVLLLRLWQWLAALLLGHYVYDPVAAMLAWGLLYWCVGAWAVWSVCRRRQVAAALVPAAILLAGSLYSMQRYPLGLLVLLVTGLPLAALTAHNTREERWHETRVDFSEDIRLDLAVVVVPLAAIIVFAAGLISSLSLQDIVSAARAFLPRQASTVVLSPESGTGSRQAVPSAAFETVRLAGLPRRHLIGSGPELSSQIVMTVQTAHASQIDEPRYYWRSLTYDTYTGHGWVSAPVETTVYRADSMLSATMPAFHFALEQNLSLVGDAGGLLYASGIVQSVGIDAQLAYRADADFFGGLVDSQSYHVLSFQPLVSESALQGAGSVYPEWLRDRYLALPDDVPARVLALARDLTAIEPTHYDRARAIERYLRTLPYTLDLPAPPLDRDVVDYFLFDLRKGYCDYYATAMVVLARAAGIPSRLVVGYAAGTFDADRGRYVVTAADAHSWVEVYFAGIGWIEFEPTAGQPALGHLTTAPLPLSNAHAVISTQAPMNVVSLGLGVLGLIGGALLVLALAAVLIVVVADWQMDHMSPFVAVNAVYGRLISEVPNLGLVVPTGDTPHELLQRFERRLTRLIGPTRDTDQGRLARQLLFTADLYACAQYGRGLISDTAGREVIVTWRRLRPAIWRARWKYILVRQKHDAEKLS